MRIAKLPLACCAFGVLLALLPLAARAAPSEVPPVRRVYATAPGATWARSGLLPFDELIARLTRADVVFLGEQHGDPATHRLQLEILQELSAARSAGVVLALEQFERDVQGSLDRYLAGAISEEQFLGESRPWPNYESDYRPLIEYCRAQGIPVVASNIPRALASRIAKEGYDAAWAAYTTEERQWIAEETTHPRDEYWWLFKDTMSGGSHGGMELGEEQIASFYAAQCSKDDTMAESVVRALGDHTGAFVVHTNGSFHSDYGLGIPRRVVDRRPGTEIVTVALRPVSSWSDADPWAETLGQSLSVEDTLRGARRGMHVADYVVFVPGPECGTDEAVPQPTGVVEDEPAAMPG